MSISSRITSITEHIGDIYDTLELGGADLTNTDKNLVNVKPILKQKYLDYMNNGTREIWNNWEKVTGTGTGEVTLNNTVNAPMDLTVKGDTSQVQTTQNANLFDENYYNNSNLYSTGTYKYTLTRIKGNRTLYVKAILKEGKTAISGLYISITSNGTNPNTGTSCYPINNGTPSNKQANFTNINDIYFSFYPTNVNVNDIFDTYNIIVSADDVSYIPFVPASPTPDYPSSINNVTGDVEVLVQNKNLLDLGNINTTKNGVLYTSQSNGALLCNGTKNGGGYQDFTNNIIHLIPGTYTCVSNLISGSITKNGIGNYPDVYLKGESSVYVGNVFGKNATNTFTVNTEGDYYFRLAIWSDNVVFDNALVATQIEYGSTSTSYTPHQEQTFTFPLGSERLMLGDYLADDGIHHVRKQIEITAQNVDSLVGGLNTTTYSKPYITISKSLLGWKSSWTQNISLINNYSVITSTSKIESGTYAVNFIQSYLTIFNDGFTDLATAKQLMIGTIIEIQQANEWIEPYTTSQQAVYNQIKQAKSYMEQTNISGSSDELEPIFEVVALKNI